LTHSYAKKQPILTALVKLGWSVRVSCLPLLSVVMHVKENQYSVITSHQCKGKLFKFTM